MFFFFFFFNDTATTEIYTLSLHDALPISAEESHGASLRKKQAAHVAIGRAQCLKHADFAAAFENGHYQSIDDPQRSHRQRKAPKQSQKQIKNGEDQAQAASGVEQRKCLESHFFYCFFDGQDIFRG